jgi:hypothetical protein
MQTIHHFGGREMWDKHKPACFQALHQRALDGSKRNSGRYDAGERKPRSLLSPSCNGAAARCPG